MLLTEIKGDLFKDADLKKFYVQCISADFAMAGGIAVKFNEVFNTKKIITRENKNYFSHVWRNYNKKFDCIQARNVFNLVTKANVWNVPTLEAIEGALTLLRNIVVAEGIETLYMPKIGCGIDQQNWETISGILMKVFRKDKIVINVYYLYER